MGHKGYVAAETELDVEKIREFARRVFTFLGDAAIAATIYLGDRLDLYRALDGAGSVTSSELAEKTGLSERWVREWLRAQAAAGLVRYDGSERFSLAPEAAWVLAKETSPAFLAGGFAQLPALLGVLEKLPQSFRTGLGYPYDALGETGAEGVERLLGPWFRTMLVPTVLPLLDGVVEKLSRGARVADVGCGAGIALLELAKAFPRSEFHGYEISDHALERAERHRAEAGVSNVFFHKARAEDLPAESRFDLVTAFDCLHDMTDPAGACRAVRRAIAEDGTFLVADVKAKPSFEENLAENPYAGALYSFSILACLSSALSEPGGAGLGTLGFPEPVARKMMQEAGFRRFRRLDVDNPFQAFYEVRP
ncbi:MAG: SAM-dependent methyltransferase [Candidatus Binatia bacterium]|nr:MAG: SAM-dependent methyltransferase [Candidatus Binatia bacterium]